MKKFKLFMAVAILLTTSSTWAQLPPNHSSLLLLKNGRLMKIVYDHSMTKKAAEIKTAFEIYGWKEPEANACVPMQPDIGISIEKKEVEFYYIYLEHQQELKASSEVSTSYPSTSIAYTIRHHAIKYGLDQGLLPSKP
jgi:hypothetical protein